MGITLSQPAEEGSAVIGLDVALTDLGREIGSLGLMPRTEIAVVNPEHRVLAYPDMSRVLVRDGDGPSLQLRTLDGLGVPSLQALRDLDVQGGPSSRLSGVWRDYAERFLSPGQIDEVDVDALLMELG
ncbi:hypothetical protein [Ottowia caeni]|uniref:hypothetical protein n=1 Tax=Ottowia caeni TaxID=2870339 RepID=UPI003D74FA82